MNQLLFAQQDSLEIYDYDFSQLSKLKITSATKTPQHITEVPSTIFIISATEIEDKGYFTLEEALSDLPGFQFRNIVGYNSYVFQRGIPSQNNLILVLIDGVQVNELNSGGFYGGGQYNLSNVERIEVVYGPGSVVYGTNAVSGIVNIITKSALENQVEINSLVGSFNTSGTDVAFCRTNEKKTAGFRVSGMTKKSDKADLKGAAGDYNWTDLMDNFENDYAFDLKMQAGDFTFGTNFQQKQSSTATLMKSTGTIYRDYGTFWNIRFINNYLKYENHLSDKFTLSSTLYNRNATVLDNTIYYVVDTAQLGYYRPNNLSGFETVLSYSANHFFSMTSGILVEYEQLAKQNSSSYSNSPEVNPPAPDRPPMANDYLASIFLEPQLTLVKSIFLSAGIRFDQSSIYDQVFTPRIGLSYTRRGQIVRISYGEAFRAPKPWDYTDGLGNSFLLPEKMKSLEAALTLSILDNLKMDLIGYKNILNNAITKQNMGASYKWINQGEINTDGVEVYIRFSSQSIKSSINYTFNNSFDSFDQATPEISKHSANASLTCSLTNHIKINVRANYVGKRENPVLITATNSFDVDPYLVFHGALSFMNYKGFNVQLIAKNIFNTTYYHTSNRMPERYRQPQRTVLLSVGYTLKNQR